MMAARSMPCPGRRECRCKRRALWLTLLLAALPLAAQDEAPRDEALRPPDEPNPYLSFLPAEAEPDWEGWKRWLRAAASERRRHQVPAAALEISEAELPTESRQNDAPALAEPILGFGSAPGERANAIVHGHLLPPPEVVALDLDRPDGAIPLAHPPIATAGRAIAMDATIGDGPFGSSGASPSGDFDVYAVSLAAGERLEVNVRTPDPLADLDPVVALFDAGGALLALNNNLILPGILNNFDSYLAWTALADAVYYIFVGGFSPLVPTSRALFPANPFEPGTGPGAGSEGAYRLEIRREVRDPLDHDVFELELRAGDVLGAAIFGARQVNLYRAEDGELLVGSRGLDLSPLYADPSPLPGGGDAALAWVVDTPGLYALEAAEAVPPSAGGDGLWRLEIGVARPTLDRAVERRTQTIFLDFDGADVERGLFGPRQGIATLSPLADFLAGWGLPASAEDAVIDTVLATAEELLSGDLRARGGNGDFDASGLFGDFDLELSNSRDHVDPARAPAPSDISRVVLGGTIAELQLATIGIAEAIDVGNFATEETAVVLLDLLSAPEGNPNSLNSIERALTDNAGMIELIGVALGRIAAHEAGHLMADYHTARDLGPATVMDRGGNLPQLLGVGQDGIFGSADDPPVRFEDDLYEDFVGTERSAAAIAFSTPAAGTRPILAISPGSLDFGALALGDSTQREVDLVNAGQSDLRVMEIDIVGAGAFALISGLTSTLGPGGSTRVEIHFAPPALGPWDAELRIRSDDPRQAEISVPLFGQGGVPRLAVTPGAHDFGDLVYADLGNDPLAAIRRVLTMRNDGDGSLNGRLVVVGPGARGFIVETDHVDIAPGASRDLEVAFHPGGASGIFDATLAVLGTDPERPRADISLRGHAFGPEIEVSPGSPFTFGAIPVGVERRRDFRVNNRGNRPLSIQGASLSGPDAERFSLVAAGPLSLTPGEEGILTVSFTPVSADLHEALFTVLSDDPDTGNLEIELLGVGTAPSLFSPLTVDFGPMTLGLGETRELRVTNVGNRNLYIDEIELTGRHDEAFSLRVTSGGFGIQPDRWVDLAPRFEPRFDGPHEATIRLQTNDPENPLTEILLVGFGGQLPAVEIPVLSSPGAALLALLLAGLAVRRSRQRAPGHRDRSRPPHG